MHHDDQASFTAEEVHQQLEEGIQRESFVDIAEGIDPEGDFERGQARPGGDGENGDHHEYPDCMSVLVCFMCLHKWLY